MAFRVSWTYPCQIQGTLKLKQDPFYYGLGYYEDVEGVKWDIVGIIGIAAVPYVQARRISGYPTYYGTGIYDNCGGTHTWSPYTVEIVETEE